MDFVFGKFVDSVPTATFSSFSILQDYPNEKKHVSGSRFLLPFHVFTFAIENILSKKMNYGRTTKNVLKYSWII